MPFLVPGRSRCRSTKRWRGSWRASPRRRPTVPRRSATFDALGRVLAADVVSLLDVPPADNSAMDGYAVRLADVAARRHGAADQPAHRRRQRRRAARSRARRRASSPARRSRPAPTPSSCRSSARRSTVASRIDVVAGGRRVDPAPRRGRRAAAPSCSPRATRLSPQALGLAASVGAATLRGRRAARASRSSPPATSWRCPASRSPGRDLQLEPLHVARADRGARLRARRPRHRPRPARRDARARSKRRPRATT